MEYLFARMERRDAKVLYKRRAALARLSSIRGNAFRVMYKQPPLQSISCAQRPAAPISASFPSSIGRVLAPLVVPERPPL